MTKRLTKTGIEWRIRNLPYPLDNYIVSANPEGNSITVKTKNKKFFKNIPVPDLDRLGLKPEQSRIEIAHQFNTLIITVSNFYLLWTIINTVFAVIRAFEARIYYLAFEHANPQQADSCTFANLNRIQYYCYQHNFYHQNVKYIQLKFFFQYKKPPELMLSEKLIFEEITKLKSAKEGDVQCNQQ